MEWVCLGIAIAAVIAAVIVVAVSRIRLKKTTERIASMLDDATAGKFEEKDFDESINSMLESRFADYLRNSALSAKRVEDEKDKIKSLISDISHQTKTPIANLMLYSELLEEEEGLTPSAGEKISAIRSQSEKLQFLIDSLVKMSRLENGILKLSTVPTELNELMEEAVSSLTSKAAAKGLELNFENTDIMVMCDPKWTLEALTNIVDNAVKYTDSGSVTLSAKRYEMFSAVSVKDTGCGISEEEKPKIFGRFYRGAAPETQTGEGVGIGLYLAREIISGEDGYIKVISKPGEGSEFLIFLPTANLTELS